MSVKQPLRSRGFSLPELIMAIVIIAVGLAGILSAYMISVRGSADPVIHKQMVAIAEEMLEEITAKPFETPTQSEGNPGGHSCGRSGAETLDWYNNYTNGAPGVFCDIDGAATTLSPVAGYRVAVQVQKPASAPGGITNTDNARLIKVIVTAKGTETFELTALRMRWDE
ncbi:MAG: prepilin-type N-terminal cleavage/methylation domain-containing protein [Zoogloeaceae bacterium]|jgi:MSHA pilin protein MshD|nr:prepilin-type N-terminal cleavage/methylation domain-containing protein [Zoogloeaceae bacterium]